MQTSRWLISIAVLRLETLYLLKIIIENAYYRCASEDASNFEVQSCSKRLELLDFEKRASTIDRKEITQKTKGLISSFLVTNG